jgi:microcystin-dependent protein
MTNKGILLNALLSAILLLGLFTTAIAQNEQKGFSFQGYARDFSGAAYSSQTITAQFFVYPEGESIEYTEQQSLSTDAFGVFHATIGTVTPVNFAAIDFSAKKYFMKVEVKVTGGDFVEITDTELLAVPYAKATEKASNGNPAGTVISFAGSNVPVGYLVCDGSAVSSTTYPELYAAIGTTWGGNATNFNLPDLRGQFLRGQDSGAGVDPDVAARKDIDGNVVGDVVGSYQDDELSGHVHGLYTEGGTTNAITVAAPNGVWNQVGKASSNKENTVSITSTGGNETRPKNAYVLFMIKY